jgi:hypothetical protein
MIKREEATKNELLIMKMNSKDGNAANRGVKRTKIKISFLYVSSKADRRRLSAT